MKREEINPAGNTSPKKINSNGTVKRWAPMDALSGIERNEGKYGSNVDSILFPGMINPPKARYESWKERLQPPIGLIKSWMNAVRKRRVMGDTVLLIKRKNAARENMRTARTREGLVPAKNR